MSTNDAGNLRQRRWAPALESFYAPKFLKRATELQRLEQLPWPRNQFGELASIAQLMSTSAPTGGHADAACSCGCRREHKQNVPQTLRRRNGRGFDVIYFWSEACKGKWNQERRRRPVSAL
jgi:hypothetical protein